MGEITEKSLKRSQFMYICEAGLEYLIALMVAGSFLATLTSQLGFSDTLTGILSSIISLGCVFQMLSVFIRRRHVKKLVILLSILNQLLFMLLYIIPVVNIPTRLKAPIFVLFIISAYLIYNIAHPKKINWLMSLIPDRERGVFTAKKQIISLIMGMLFTYGMGALVDFFADKDQYSTAFTLVALVVFVVMVLHTTSMVLAVEPEPPAIPYKRMPEILKNVLGNKNVLHVTIVFVLYNIATHLSTPFFATYLIGELSLNLKTVSALTIVSSIVRIAAEMRWGRYADRTSFSNMTQKCLMVLAAAYLCVFFATPAVGLYAFILYYTCHGIAMGGISSAMINLIYDYVDIDKRADSLAICQAAYGVAGFVATLAISPFVALMQARGNVLFGITVYAQQIMALGSCVVVVACLLYVKHVLVKKSA